MWRVTSDIAEDKTTLCREVMIIIIVIIDYCVQGTNAKYTQEGDRPITSAGVTLKLRLGVVQGR